MNFGQALEDLKAGRDVTRKFLGDPEYRLTYHKNTKEIWVWQEGCNEWMTWEPTLSDILAGDWVVSEISEEG